MFELEIMITGYTVVVATASTVISRCVSRKKINNISDELSTAKMKLLNAEAEIKQLKKTVC